MQYIPFFNNTIFDGNWPKLQHLFTLNPLCYSMHDRLSYSFMCFFLKIVFIQSTDFSEWLMSFYLYWWWQRAPWSQSPRKCHRSNWSILLDQMRWSRTTAFLLYTSRHFDTPIRQPVVDARNIFDPWPHWIPALFLIRHHGLCMFSFYLQRVKVQPLQRIYA